MVKDGPKAKPTAARFALASNIKHLMDTYSKGFAVGISPSELQKGSGVNAKTIRRVINPYSDTGPSLETIDALADFFHVQSWELLVPRPSVLQGTAAGPAVPAHPTALSKRK
jgi:hypothetical protein